MFLNAFNTFDLLILCFLRYLRFIDFFYDFRPKILIFYAYWYLYET